MPSLTTHLRRPEDHARLPFHPDCPMCRRERLAGSEPPDALVGHRTQALLAASVLALSSAPPTAALASEPDQEREGATSPDQVAAADPLADPESDPGGSSTELPVEPGPPVPMEQTDPGDDAALEEELLTDDPPAEESGTADVPQEEQPATTEPVPAPPAAASPPSEPPPLAPAPPEAVASEPVPERERESVRKPPRRTKVAAPRETVMRFVAPQAPPDDIGWSSPASVHVAPAEPGAAPTPDAHRGRAAQRRERTHVVRANESLWSIARDLLGDQASPARIAREVNRLWELNNNRIGTGDPDLLLAGTRLRLR